MIKYFKEINLKKGDLIAIGASGSLKTAVKRIIFSSLLFLK